MDQRTQKSPGYPGWTEWGAPGSLADDAREKARTTGLTNGMAALYDSDNYDLDVIATGYMPDKGGTTPESLDVIVNLGTFPSNQAPTVSISPATRFLAEGALNDRVSRRDHNQ